MCDIVCFLSFYPSQLFRLSSSFKEEEEIINYCFFKSMINYHCIMHKHVVQHMYLCTNQVNQVNMEKIIYSPIPGPNSTEGFFTESTHPIATL